MEGGFGRSLILEVRPGFFSSYHESVTLVRVARDQIRAESRYFQIELDFRIHFRQSFGSRVDSRWTFRKKWILNPFDTSCYRTDLQKQTAFHRGTSVLLASLF